MVIRPDFLRHYKTVFLCGRLAEEHAHVYLIRLWGHCETTKSWRLPQDPNILAAICEYRGEPKKFLEAMVMCGWIDVVDDHYLAHDWEDHNAGLIQRWNAGEVNRKKREKITALQCRACKAAAWFFSRMKHTRS